MNDCQGQLIECLKVIECLKECNIILEKLRTEEYRYVAWLIYSVEHKCFISGVDTYWADEKNIPHGRAIAKSESPNDAIRNTYDHINDWHQNGAVPSINI